MAHVRHAAGAPVDAALSLHKLFVDEVAPQGGEVGVPAADDAVHVRLGVEAAGLEVLDEPAQDSHALLVLDGDRDQPSGDVDEVLEHAAIEVDSFAFHPRLSTLMFVRGRGMIQVRASTDFVGDSTTSALARSQQVLDRQERQTLWKRKPSPLPAGEGCRACHHVTRIPTPEGVETVPSARVISL